MCPIHVKVKKCLNWTWKELQLTPKEEKLFENSVCTILWNWFKGYFIMIHRLKLDFKRYSSKYLYKDKSESIQNNLFTNTYEGEKWNLNTFSSPHFTIFISYISPYFFHIFHHFSFMESKCTFSPQCSPYFFQCPCADWCYCYILSLKALALLNIHYWPPPFLIYHSICM